MSDLEVTGKRLYDEKNGILSEKLGLCKSDEICKNCNKNFLECPGHFGHLNLSQNIFHNGYFKRLLNVLKIFCFNCGKIIVEIPENLEIKIFSNFIYQKSHFKKILEKSKEVKSCFYCKTPKVAIKKLGHGLNRIITNVNFGQSSSFSGQLYTNLKKNLLNEKKKKNINENPQKFFELNPNIIRRFLKSLNKFHWKFLLMNPTPPKPENLIVSIIPVPPICIRPSVEMSDNRSNEDDLTIKIFELIQQKYNLQKFIKEGRALQKIEEQRYNIQILYNQLLNSECSESNSVKNKFNSSKGLIQRIKGKQGRFRQNLSGKRVEYSGRTVISPDPNLLINEVSIPLHMAKELTFPETITKTNKSRLKKNIINGIDIYPGANRITINNEIYVLKNELDRAKVVEKLKIGDVVHRHLIRGDTVLFNRQPSLHRQSIMGFNVRVHEGKTLKFNECVCSPFNADFDGDEMNLHVLQSVNAKAEALFILKASENLLNPKDGSANISLIQDFLTNVFIITSKDFFLDRARFCKLLSFATDAEVFFDIPMPTVFKPRELWTGKQLIDTLLNPSSKKIYVDVNLKQKEKSYDGVKGMKEFDENEGYVRFKNGKLLTGRLGKSTMGGSKSGLIYFIIKRCSNKRAALFMSYLSKLSARFIEQIGLSFGLRDVTPDSKISTYNKTLFSTKNIETHKIITKFLSDATKKNKKPTNYQNLSFEKKKELESQISSLLNKARDEAGKFLLATLLHSNNAYIMAISGAKGSALNICQMVSTVGQQSVQGNRIQNGFLNRTLPHFPQFDLSPKARGFVQNSFYTGLHPTEFFFHTMAGREGLIDTAVKTADTGYMQRRLIKVMEDLVVEYDYTVRNAEKKLVQFVYGEDGFDPVMNEHEDFPIKLFTLDPVVEGFSEFCEEVTEEKTELENEFYVVWGGVFPKKFVNEKFDTHLHRFFVFLEGLKLGEKKKRDLFGKLKRNLFMSVVHPGEAVGAITSQSLGEPCTQMTLKTFHFAGVASMNVTLGVPRIKEIFNATNNIKTPIIEVHLNDPFKKISSNMIKNKINCVFLKDVLNKIVEIYDRNKVVLELEFDYNLIKSSLIGFSLSHVKHVLIKSKLKLKEKNVLIKKNKITISSPLKNSQETMFYFKHLLNKIKNLVVYGLKTVTRAILNDRKEKGMIIFAEGTGLHKILRMQGVNHSQTKTNHIQEINTVLGIEAARATIIDQVKYTMSIYGINVDYRHLTVLADTMTCIGSVMGLNRYGIVKMKNSPIMVASFERTGEVLYDAAFFGTEEFFKGVSEKIIIGDNIKVGTGIFDLLVEGK